MCHYIYTVEIKYALKVEMQFKYNSVQSHSKVKNGKLKTKTTRVTVKGSKGYKSVEIKERNLRKSASSAKTRRSKKALTQKEIKCIKDCQFIPGLFKDCINVC